MEQVENHKNTSPDAILGILGVSDAIELDSHRGLNFKKNVTVQLRLMKEVPDDSQTELVVIRYDNRHIQVLDKSQARIITSGPNYTVDMKECCGIAIARIRRIFLNMRDTIKKEFQIIFGQIQLSAITTFIIDGSRQGPYLEFWVECIEKEHLKQRLEERLSQGLVEIKSSRSRDVLCRQKYNISISIKGQMYVEEFGYDSEERLTITFLRGADNHVRLSVRLKQELESVPYGSLVFSDDNDATLHSVSVATRELLEYPIDEITAQELPKLNESNEIRVASRKTETTSASVLSLSSLMVLAHQLTLSETKRLVQLLGLKQPPIRKIEEECEDSDVTQTKFRILCRWRDKRTNSTMADFLVSSLRIMGKSKIGDTITEKRQMDRGLISSDFNTFN